MKRFMTRSILLLSIISLCTDIASEMIYPILPLYLTQMGYSYVALGLVFGVADAFSGVTKGLFGYLSDRMHNPTLFVRIGYGISAFAKPALALTNSMFVVMGARIADRIGKGIRTAPRDAILASDSTPETRGTVFGFHRSMDTLGATIGPIIAALFLIYSPGNLRDLFVYSLIPGSIALACAFLLKNKKNVVVKKTKKEGERSFSFPDFWKQSSGGYKKILIGLVLLSLVNSADAFLILRAREILHLAGFNLFGLSIEVGVILLYILFNCSFTLWAFPLGIVSDKFGFKGTFIAGLLIFSGVHALLGFDVPLYLLAGIFVIWGAFAAINEAVGKAWLSLHIPKGAQGTGIGLYLSLNALCIFLANLFMGSLWQSVGAARAYSIVAMVSLVVLVYFVFLENPKVEKSVQKN